MDQSSTAKALDGEQFETLASVDGAGNSSTPLSYEVNDEHPFKGLNYYRLKQTDMDGKFIYSNVISYTALGTNRMRVLSVNPNPVQFNAVINMDLSETEDVKVKVVNSKGQSVYDNIFPLRKGIQKLEIPLQNLDEGIYMMQVRCESGDYSQKLIKTK